MEFNQITKTILENLSLMPIRSEEICHLVVSSEGKTNASKEVFIKLYRRIKRDKNNTELISYDEVERTTHDIARGLKAYGFRKEMCKIQIISMEAPFPVIDPSTFEIVTGVNVLIAA